ncbi:hypothetical protein PALB_26880 [Pseudoalteromonas luteoviolacea B = ATCC 29581]|nr:hypothetical protein PALB_26880 [Pseudoalteromonas luteoviolacea B = ATCC 29581]
MPVIRWFIAFTLCLFLVACGGGGSITKDGSITDGSGANYIMKLALIGENGEPITNSSPLTVLNDGIVTVSLTKNGQPLSEGKINLTVNNQSAQLQQNSITTGSDGAATVRLKVGENAGLGTLTASYTPPTGDSITLEVEFVSNGNVPVYKLNVVLRGANGSEISETTPISLASPATIEASLVYSTRAQANVPVVGELIEFTTEFTGKIDPESGVVATNASGVAVAKLLAGENKGAGRLTASFTAPDDTIISVVKTFTSNGPEPVYTLSLSLKDTSGNAFDDTNPLSSSNKGTATAQLFKLGQPLADKIVNFSTEFTGTVEHQSGAIKTNSSGLATITIGPGASEGAGKLIAVHTALDGTVVKEEIVFVSAGDPKQHTMTLDLKDTNGNSFSDTNRVTSLNPGTATIKLMLNGSPVVKQLVEFTTEFTGQLAPNSGLVETNENGMATIQLLPGVIKGAGRLNAKYQIDNTTSIVRSTTFTSAGASTYSINLKLVDQNGQTFNGSNEVKMTNPGFVTATLLKDGLAVPNQLLNLSTLFTGELNPASGLVVTNGNGDATARLTSGTQKGAGKLIAQYQLDNNVQARTEVAFNSSGDGVPIQQSQYNISVQLLQNCNAGWESNRNAVELDPNAPSSGCKITNNLDSTLLTDVFVKLTSRQTEVGIANEIIQLNTDLGEILPQSGKVLTDKFGIGLLKLQPETSGGAGTILAQFDGESGGINFSFATPELTLSLTNGLKSDGNGGEIPLKAGGSTLITATLSNSAGGLYTIPTQVKFTSTCVAQGTAKIDESVTSSNGIAISTYRADGCSIEDTITVTVETGSRNITEQTKVKVDSAAVQSIQFDSASNGFIGLPPGQSGVPTQSIVKFRLVDADGNFVSQKRIDFRLADSTGKAKLTQLTGSTDSQGFVQTVVTSGSVPGPLVVEACYIPNDRIVNLPTNDDDLTCWQEKIDQCIASPTTEGCPKGSLTLIPFDEQISAVSSRIVLSAGVTDQNSFDASPSVFNTNSLNYNGVTTNITVYFGDQFNQLTSDGLVATVFTEAGVVGTIDGQSGNSTFNCETTDATCQLTWRSQGERPFSDAKWKNKISDVCDLYFGAAAPCIGGLPTTVTESGVTRNVIPGGRVSVLVTTKGQETFIDKQTSGGITRTNGLFDEGEFTDAFDLPEAFNDYNENGVFNGALCTNDASDPCAPANSNGGHDEIYVDRNSNGIWDDKDTKYNGLLCSAEAQKNGKCTKELIDVRKQFELIMSGDNPYVRFAVSSVGNANCASQPGMVLEPSNHSNYCDIKSLDLSAGAAASATIYIFYSDVNNNPLPAGTKINVSASNGDFELNFIEQSVGNSTSKRPAYAAATLSREPEGNSDFSGALSISFEIPSPFEGGDPKSISYGLSVIDDR